MAVYVYACDACGAEFDVEHPVNRPAGATCPKCGTDTKRRLIQPTAFVLRGAGWASDGYINTRRTK